MTYPETLDYLYSRLPMFQRIGAAAFKKDLTNTHRLLAALNNPEKQWPSIHIAGTNGKGSSSHALAAILQAAGYKTGLYTSPHLKNFTERIRINGQEASQEFVVSWVAKNKGLIEEVSPSFFEVTVAMAFDYFAQEKIDIAVIEVGMGGRLDSTNVIQPLLSLITNIGLDHTQFLGDTLEAIAGEKAGIIKAETPVVIGHTQPETTAVFNRISAEKNASITFAEANVRLAQSNNGSINVWYRNSLWLEGIRPELKADYFLRNLPGVLESVRQLPEAFAVTDAHIAQGLAQLVSATGFKGRWQQLASQPFTIADISHNPAGLAILLDQVKEIPYRQLHIVLGMVNDKDISASLNLLPAEAFYYFCQAKIPRAMPAEELAGQAYKLGLSGTVTEDVNEALELARKQAKAEDMILITGSAFVVAEINEL